MIFKVVPNSHPNQIRIPGIKHASILADVPAYVATMKQVLDPQGRSIQALVGILRELTGCTGSKHSKQLDYVFAIDS